MSRRFQEAARDLCGLDSRLIVGLCRRGRGMGFVRGVPAETGLPPRFLFGELFIAQGGVGCNVLAVCLRALCRRKLLLCGHHSKLG